MYSLSVNDLAAASVCMSEQHLWRLAPFCKRPPSAWDRCWPVVLYGAPRPRLTTGVAFMLKGYSGWGNGFNTATTPVWVSELSPAKSRGRMIAAEGSLIAFGIVIASYYNIGMYYTKGPVVWRAPIASQLVFIIVQFVLVAILPESPRWLLRRGSTPCRDRAIMLTCTRWST